MTKKGVPNLKNKARLTALWQNSEYRKHMSEAHLGQKSWNKGMLGYNLGHPVSAEARRKIGNANRIALKGRHLSEEVKRKLSIAGTGAYRSPEQRDKISNTLKNKWANDKKFVSMMIHSCHRRPTKPETALDAFLQKNFPNEWRYTGNGQGIY